MTATLEHTSVDERLDALAEQVAFIADELADQRRVRLQAAELVHDLSPITGALMERATGAMSELDDKGYVEFVGQLIAIIDRVVTSFGPDDVKALGDNVVLILEAVKEMTQPEVMTMLRRTAVSAQHVDADISTAPSMLGLARELRDPEVRLGLARTLSVLRTIGAESANK
jgi:uncharacterized protein YjgD (DUF1641 family)